MQSTLRSGEDPRAGHLALGQPAAAGRRVLRLAARPRRVVAHRAARLCDQAEEPVHPRLVECAVPLTNCDDPAWHYEFGVDMFMAGVTALAAARAAREGRSAT